jgi:tyrosyl-tRNA synthetase
MLNNAEWLDGLNYLDFLRDIGRHFSVNRMLSSSREVAARPRAVAVVSSNSTT